MNQQRSAHPRIWYDPAVLRRDLLDLEAALVAAITHNEVILGPGWVTDFCQRAHRLRHDLQKPFTICLVGNFKRGKSTLINALVGSPVVTTNVAPETITINRIGYGETLQVTGLLADGGRLLLNADELAADRLEPLLQQLDQPIVHLDIACPVETLRGILLVDTPGLGDLNRAYDEQVIQYLPSADVILFVISAFAPLAQEERVLLSETLLPQEFAKICCVVNMLDMLPSVEDSERVLTSIRARLHHLLPGAAVFGVSALDEVCRQYDEPRPVPERAAELEGRFADLREHLATSILFNRDLIQTERALLRLDALIGHLQQRVEQIRLALEADSDQVGYAIQLHEEHYTQLHQHIERERQAFHTFMETCRAEAVAWLREFLHRLRTETLAHLTDHSSADVQRHLQFFLSDVCREALTKCFEAHDTAIREEAARVDARIRREVEGLKTMATRLDQTVAAVDQIENRWSTLDTLQTAFLSFSLSVAGLSQNLLVVAGLALLKGRGQAEKAVQQYQDRLLAALPDLEAGLIAEVTRIYAQIGEQIAADIEDTHHREIKAALTALQQTQLIHERLQQEAAGAGDVLTVLSRLTADVQARAVHLRHKLERIEE